MKHLLTALILITATNSFCNKKIKLENEQENIILRRIDSVLDQQSINREELITVFESFLLKSNLAENSNSIENGYKKFYEIIENPKLTNPDVFIGTKDIQKLLQLYPVVIQICNQFIFNEQNRIETLQNSSLNSIVDYASECMAFGRIGKINWLDDDDLLQKDLVKIFLLTIYASFDNFVYVLKGESIYNSKFIQHSPKKAEKNHCSNCIRLRYQEASGEIIYKKQDSEKRPQLSLANKICVSFIVDSTGNTHDYFFYNQSDQALEDKIETLLKEEVIWIPGNDKGTSVSSSIIFHIDLYAE